MSLITPPSDADLMPEIIAYAIPPFKTPGVRCKPLLRIKRIGQVFFVEHCREQRAMGPDGKDVITDDWKQVAIAKPPNARKDAFTWLWEANTKLIGLSATSP